MGGWEGVTLVGGVAFNYPDRSIPSDTRSMLIRGDRDERIPPNSGLALSLLSPLSPVFSLLSLRRVSGDGSFGDTCANPRR